MRRYTTLSIALALIVAGCATGAVSTPGPASQSAAPASAAAASPSPAPSASARTYDVAVAFDGQTCTYTGPLVVPRGATFDFLLTNTPAALKGSRGAALVVFHIAPETTWADVQAAVKTHAADEPPEWVDLIDLGVLYPEDASAGTALTWTLAQDRYVVMCTTAPEDTNKAYAAALIQTLQQ